jgi:CheY-like chemotaxis protein
VTLDRGELEHVLLNLLLNAKDAMPAGGVVVVATTRPPAADGDAAIVLSVTDSGSGMSDDVLARAFDPFFTTKPTGEGSGLGLATVLGVVQRAGGSVTIDSAPGRGTSVRIVLPAGELPAPNDAEGDTIREPSGTVAARGLVLVVDDDEAMLESMARLLERSGFSVVAADSGEQALDLLATEPRPDLVVSDVAMPGLSGVALATAVEDRYSIPTLLVSAWPERSTDDADGGLMVLPKPFTAEALVEAAARLLARDVTGAGPDPPGSP